MASADFDAELIRALREDGRASVRALAAELGQSRAAVAARLRLLLEDRTIRIIGAVDPSFLGQHVIAHVSVRTSGAIRDVAAVLQGMEETVFVSAVAGVHDLVTEVRLGTMSELHAVIESVRSIPQVLDVNTLVYTSVVKGPFVSSYRGQITIDEIDAALIEQLQADGRASFRALGEVVRLSPSAVATRVQRLRAAHVIQIGAVEARGPAHRRQSMGVGVNLRGDDDGALALIRSWPGVDFVARTIGRFDAVITFVEPSPGALHEGLERLRALPSVSHTEAWLHLAVLKEDYARQFPHAPE
ncbi:AsnC family transcriptional regulator [Microbacterium sp. 8M]|uniref:Lrp/AsnC family transcriptional regulator n=1 Tax=Microbacterium sp. 8M TaxID=2653153 RepID=UPI0012F309D3|nr:Lrp/AsnC family transcriptional regulator [Microbacterium sp. 8M]VXB88755.1 AsnC family transcriptional regulator [Microbacterium sp. 8M]